jgi:bacterial/archaeal transporter family-2 protein
MSYVRYAVWAAVAGAFIPVMAVLNARLGRSLGVPIHAAFVLFVVGLLTSALASLALTRSLPSPSTLVLASPVQYAGGIIVAFYIVTVGFLAPRLGVGNTILFVMVGQVLTSACIDHFGLMAATPRPISGVRALGLVFLLAGLAVTQAAAGRSATP